MVSVVTVAAVGVVVVVAADGVAVAAAVAGVKGVVGGACLGCWRP